VAGFYSARRSIMPPLPWTTFAPPLSYMRLIVGPNPISQSHILQSRPNCSVRNSTHLLVLLLVSQERFEAGLNSPTNSTICSKRNHVPGRE